jgi:hypothetical protein
MQLNALIVFMLSICAVGGACAAECGAPPPHEMNLDSRSTKTLASPDRKWLFMSVGFNSSDKNAILYVQNTHTSRKWNVASIERAGTAFWSEDSKRVFLRDEYAADDTKVRVFDLTGSVPTEVRGLDRSIRRAIFARIPASETTQWLYYPRVCFAADDSSTIILVADAPLVLKNESSEGKDFGLRLTVNLASLRITVSGPEAPRFP